MHCHLHSASSAQLNPFSRQKCPPAPAQLPRYLEQAKRRPCHFPALIPFILWLGYSLPCFLLGPGWWCRCCYTVSCSRAEVLLRLTDFVTVCALSHKLKCGKSFLLFLSDFHLLCACYKTMININQDDTNWRGQPAKGHMHLTSTASHWIVTEWGRFCCTCSFTN